MEERRISLSAQNANRSGFRLDGKVAVVTGGASGIGQAIVESFVESGAFVHILDIDENQAQKVAQRLSDGRDRAAWHRCDVANQQEVKDVFCRIGGSSPIHIVVNNAGVSHIGRLENTSEADFDRIFRINVKGVYNCMLAAIDYLKSGGGGTILNIASIAATVGLADRFAYSMSKGAVLTMTYSVARDYVDHKIRCNCISPARVHTPFVDGFLRKNYPGHEADMFDKLSQLQPIGRMAQPAEVAALALFLCSDEASFITGTNYPIDGGFLNLHG
jgi:NAD(P)-dependent dehydrogenase (short-subunit alcohol dehydrogenase family)